MKIITTKRRFINIDSFAGAYAYSELLTLLGKKTKVILTGKFDYTVTKEFRLLNSFQSTLENFLKEKQDFIIINASNPKDFEKFVKIKKVEKVFDNNLEYKNYWIERIGKKVFIKPSGATSTFIFNEFKKNKLVGKMSKESGKLLATAILGATYNFKEGNFLKDDLEAYEELKNYFDYEEDFEKKYFGEIQKHIEENIINSINYNNESIKIGGFTFFISQLETIDSNSIKTKYFLEINDFLKKRKENICLFNLIDIKTNNNYIFFRDNFSILYFENFFKDFNYEFDKNISSSDGIIFKDDIIKKLYSSIFL